MAAALLLTAVPLAFESSEVPSEGFREIPNQVAGQISSDSHGASEGASQGSSGSGAGWYASHLSEATEVSVVVDDGGDQELNVRVSQSEGSIAKDLVVTESSGHSYSATLRASSPSGLPVLVELTLHGLVGEGEAGESASRLVMVEGYEVPITVNLEPDVDYSAVRAELYVHTVGRDVRIDDAALRVDSTHHGADNYGYQQPRVRYLDDVDPSQLEPGGNYRVEITVGTTSDQPWACCSDVGPIRLGTEDEDLVGGSDRESVLFVEPTVDGSAWIAPNRIHLGEASVGQDGERYGGTFTTMIKAPTTPGLFAERFRVVAEDVTWLPGPVIELIGAVIDPEASLPTEPTDTIETQAVPATPAASETPEAPPTTEAPTSDVPVAGPAPTLPVAPNEPSGEAVEVCLYEETDGSDRVVPTADEDICQTTVTEIETDFDLEVADIGPGTMTIQWAEPGVLDGEDVSGESLHYMVDLWYQAVTSPPATEPFSRFITAEPSLLITGLEADHYRVEAIAVSSSGQWGRSSELDVQVLEHTPLIEVEIPPIERCEAPAGQEASEVGLCTADPISTPSCSTVQLEFERSTLLGYGGLDRSEWVQADLACSRYRMVLRSIDEQHRAGYQLDQTEERWYLEGVDAEGHVVYRSPTTPDLPADQTEASFEVASADLDDVVSFRARHLRARNSADSIRVEAILIPVG
ncbi:MAG: hypothetical protein ACRBK7_13170 [Acidimicrobiales bacterium]